MPQIHSGASTHHHDQAITPVSLSTTSAGTVTLVPRFQIWAPVPGWLKVNGNSRELIHSGSSTHHHDQATTPVSLSAMSAGSASAQRTWSNFQIRSASQRRGSRRNVTATAPG